VCTAKEVLDSRYRRAGAPGRCRFEEVRKTLGRPHARSAPSAPSGFALSALGLLLFGLLTSLFSREEVYANLEYGFSVLALFGAAGCIGHLAASIYRSSGARAFACRLPGRTLPAAVAPGSVPCGTAGWPVLVALLLGPLVVLLSGLGGWV
jgi:hypothetical protein